MKTTKYYITTEKSVPEKIKNQLATPTYLPSKFYGELYTIIKMAINQFASSLDTNQMDEEYLTNFLHFDEEGHNLAIYILKIPSAPVIQSGFYIGPHAGIELKVQSTDDLSSNILSIINDFGFEEIERKIPKEI